MRKLFGLLEFKLKYLVAAIILAVPLYPKFPSIRIPGTFVSVRIEDFLLAFTALVVAINIIPRIRKVIASNIERAMVVYVLVGVVSLLSAIFLTQTVVPHLGALHWARRIEYFIPFLLGSIYFLKGKRTDVEFFLKVLMLTIFIAFIYGLGQKYLHWPLIITQNEEYSKGIALRWIAGSHINSTFAGHYDLATFLVLTLPTVVSLFFLIKGKVSKLLIGVVFFSGLWLLANAVSRISIVSFLLSGTLSLLIIRKYKAIPIFLIVSAILFGFSGDLWARYGRIFEVTKGKIEKILLVPGTVYAASTPVASPIPVFEDRSTSIRLNVEWPRAVRAFSKNPLLGTGYSSITLATDNDYLRLFGETGLLGALSFLMILVGLLTQVVKAIPQLSKMGIFEKAYLAGIVGSLPGVFLNAVFIDIFEASKFAIIFRLLTGLAVGLIRRYQNEQTI